MIRENMSSFDTAREKWENYHLGKIAEYKEAAKNGDPEAMEKLAYHTQQVLYPTREEIITMLTFAAEKGRETAYWKLADLYANWDRKEHHDKIEHYCRLAFASGKIFTDKAPECFYGSIQYWITEHHPEWCEMEEGFRSDGSYYIRPTYRYGLNVFCGVGEEQARRRLLAPANKKNADYAIAMKVRRVQPDERIDPSCSKFFGAPCVPESMRDPYPDDGVFFAQIRCSDIRDLDPENRLPHEGYLYFFLDAEMYPDDQLHMMVDHTINELKYVIDDYNENCNIKGLTDTYVITFEKVDAGYEGTKLLGYPANDVDDSDERTGLLMQYDPLDFEVPFLSTLDGYAFVFFGDDDEDKFSGVEYVVWGS